ncbi:hypothetical protein D3C81_1800870 [compost metagenome]
MPGHEHALLQPQHGDFLLQRRLVWPLTDDRQFNTRVIDLRQSAQQHAVAFVRAQMRNHAEPEIILR